MFGFYYIALIEYILAGKTFKRLDEISHNDLMSEKYKKTCKYVNYIEHLHITFNS